MKDLPRPGRPTRTITRRSFFFVSLRRCGWKEHHGGGIRRDWMMREWTIVERDVVSSTNSSSDCNTLSCLNRDDLSPPFAKSILAHEIA